LIAHIFIDPQVEELLLGLIWETAMASEFVGADTEKRDEPEAVRIRE
jgi:hypothetical protein